MRKIIFITKANGWGGTEKHLLELLQRIVTFNLRCLVIEEGTSVYKNEIETLGLRQTEVRAAEVTDTPYRCFSFFLRSKGDVVVFINGCYGLFPWYSTVLARAAGVRKCYSIHHLIAPPRQELQASSVEQKISRLLFRGWRARLLVWSSRLCTKTICVSDAVRNRLVHDYGYSGSSTVTIRNGVQAQQGSSSDKTRDMVRKRMSIGMDDVVAICVARLAAVKGIDVLIRAMALLKDRQIKCRCLVIGDGPLAEPLSSLAASLGVSDLVIFKGFQNDVWPYLLASDIFVLPSYSEGLPFSVLEAMACALPCVVTDVGGNREAVEHGVHGLVVPPGSEENLGAAVAKLVMDYETRKKMAQAAKLRAKREFDIDDRMSEVVQTLLT